MFAIKVVDPVDLAGHQPEESVFSCDAYTVNYDGEVPKLYFAVGYGDGTHQFEVGVHNVAYIINAAGKTIDTIRNRA